MLLATHFSPKICMRMVIMKVGTNPGPFCKTDIYNLNKVRLLRLKTTSEQKEASKHSFTGTELEIFEGLFLSTNISKT